jgi:hypothetical protein
MIHDVRTETRWFTTKSHSTWHVLTAGDRAVCRANIRPCGQTYSDAERGAYPLPIPRCLACLRKRGAGTVLALRDGETLDTAPVQRDAHVQSYLANRAPDARTFALNMTGSYPPAESVAHDCPCCGDIIYSGPVGSLCDDCLKAECEPNREGAYDDCQRPCETCGVPSLADFYVCAVYITSEGETTYSDGYVCESHVITDSRDVPGSLIPSDATVLEYDVHEITR